MELVKEKKEKGKKSSAGEQSSPSRQQSSMRSSRSKKNDKAWRNGAWTGEGDNWYETREAHLQDNPKPNIPQ